MKNNEEITEILQEKYQFYKANNLQEFKDEIVGMVILLAESQPEYYNKIENKYLFFDEFIKDCLRFCEVDLTEKCYLHYLMKAGQEIFEVKTHEEVLRFCKKEFNKKLEEMKTTLILSVADVFELLEVVENMLVLPEKWLSPIIYKKLGEFLKTFNCERIKYKKRVAFINKGEFTTEQIIKIGKELNGVSLSEEFDFYPTPKELCEKVRNMAEIKENDLILEPSAGTGNLIKGLNPQNIDCIEINQVLASILKTKGYNVLNADFLEEKTIKNNTYDKILMNPPFTRGLDAKHILKAFDLLKVGGVLIAIHTPSILTKTDKTCREFQRIYNQYSVCSTENKAGDFAESGKGTNILTLITKFIKE